MRRGQPVSAAPVLLVSHVMNSSIAFLRQFSEYHNYIFQINFFKKGAEMFSQSMDSFLASVADMVQR